MERRYGRRDELRIQVTSRNRLKRRGAFGNQDATGDGVCVETGRFRIATGLACLLAGVLLSASAVVPAADQTRVQAPEPAPESAAKVEATAAEVARNQRFAAILESIKAAQAERADIGKRLKTSSVETDSKELEEDIKRLDRRLEELQTSFEELATGGASIAALEQSTRQPPLNWQKEIDDILRPLLYELKRLTERPRTIERLRSEQAVLEDRLETADRALARLGEALAKADSASLKKALTELKQDWTSRRADTASRMQLIEGQLDRLTAPDAAGTAGVLPALREFVSGRGLTALLAATGFAVTYLLLTFIGNLATRRALQRRESRARSLAKAGGMLFRAFSLLVALLTAMAVLYVRGDWLILGLLILVIFAFAISLRNALPRYIAQLRTILNLGAVREGERVVYRDIPWRIKSLNLYSTLHNPLLRGGTIRIPIDAVSGLHSRQYSADEPWFPTRENDFVILDGDVFGKVLLQTPDVVQLQVIGATQTFAVADYLGRHPRNLSLDGFAVPVTFGLDYRHQADILTGVTTRLRERLMECSRQQPFHPFLKNLLVEFNEAASSSLNLIIVAVFDGPAAEHYWSIRRFLQQTAVDACNHYGWTIPFDQLMLHLHGEPEALSTGGAAPPPVVGTT